MTKPKIAISWNSSCGGCDESIVDIEDKILDIAAKVEFVLWPCAMDFKYDHVRALPDGDITVSLINGGIQNSHQEEIARLIRKKSKTVVAFGACAWLGGVPSLINLKNKEELFKSSYLESISVENPRKTLPAIKSKVDNCTLTLPEIYDTLYKLDDIIGVDYYLPGCPPTADLITDLFLKLIEGGLPEKGAVLAPARSLCISCPRNETKPDNFEIDEIKRIHEIIADPEKCFLVQNLLCMGPSTRDGCGCSCIKGNMPCTGCFGPADKSDQGAKMIGTLGSILKGSTESEADRVIDGIADPAGTFYRYSTAASMLGRKRKEDR